MCFIKLIFGYCCECVVEKCVFCGFGREGCEYYLIDGIFGGEGVVVCELILECVVVV